ncbi:hypothetical protein D915_005047 [Fasciola hepatica]|uniref:Protein unc-79 n=1 Tax=Fasciola hepatica TaxID=6192 RepID=A0A4E0RU23_FASHE|nr:hypothetical protein D915_005047 [Fasciola hepatica]
MSNPSVKSQNFHSRLKLFQEICGKLFSGVGNPPSSSDLIGHLKFFQNTLQNISKEIQDLQIDRFYSKVKDEQWRAQNIPQFEYGELYLCILNLSENAQKMTNQSAVCEHILRTLHNLLIFLDYECLEGVPLAIAWMLVYFPVAVQPSILEFMCSVVIPLIYNNVSRNFLLLQQNITSGYSKAFLARKRNYTSKSSKSAWPEVFGEPFAVVLFFVVAWKPLTCDRTDCPNKAGKALAMKMTVNPRISAQHGGKPPPLYVCLDCADALNRRDFDQLVDILLPSKQASLACGNLITVISLICESKTCRSKNNQASVTCWSPGCTFLTGNRAIRFCDACHTLRHSYGQTSNEQEVTDTVQPNEAIIDAPSRVAPGGGKSVHPGFHAYQMPVPEVWDMALDLQSCMVEAVVSLTRETMPRWRQVLLGGGDASDDRAVAGLTCTGANPPGGPPAGGDMILLGVSTSATATGLSMVGSGGAGAGVLGPADKYGNNNSNNGIPLMKSLHFQQELLTRITAGIFKWFVDTIYTAEVGSSYDGRGTLRQRYELGDLLERVKSEYILKWIQEVQRLHPEAIFAVLLPHPLEYARIGSCWDALCDRTTQVKHGLSRIGSLIPYDIVTFETWDFVMPYWLETIRTEVPRGEYFELEVLLKKIFDATAGPFPFLPQKVYHFAAERFTNTPVAVQDQALAWLEILTSVEVPIPMKELLTMFRNGVESFQIEILLPSSTTPYDGNEDLNLEMGNDSSEDLEVDERKQPRGSSMELAVLRADFRTGQIIDAEAEDEDDETFPPSTRSLLMGPTNTDVVSEPRMTDDGESPNMSEDEEALIPDERVGLLGTTRGNSVTSSVKKTRMPLRRKRESTARSRSTVARTECGLRIQEEFMQSQQLSRLKFHDPFGHAGYAQETPQLLLSLLGDMLQLYWGHEDVIPQRGLRHLCCAGLDTCVLPGPRSATACMNSEHPGSGRQNDSGGADTAGPTELECLDCLNMLTWLNYADLICQHMAPLRPSPKTNVEFSIEALTKASEFPEYTDWRVSAETESTGHDEDDWSRLPAPSDLASMPPVVRVIYLLVCFLRDPTKSVSRIGLPTNDYPDPLPDASTEPQSDLHNSGNNASLLSNEVHKGRVSRDPIVLQCIIECLVYLCHVGDCLQQLLNKTQKSLPGATTSAAMSSGNPVTASTVGTGTSATGTTIGGPPQTGTALGTAGKVTLVSKTNSSGTQNPGVNCGACTATPQAQTNFVHYLVHCHLIPSLWGMLKSEWSHLASWVVPLLLHCLSLPGGSRVFWRLIETDFGHSDWRVRFDAIEKTTVLLRELDPIVLSGGFSGVAGMKINSILSGGSMAGTTGVNLFGRPATVTHLRARGAVGRMVAGKNAPGLSRGQAAHGNGPDGASKPGLGIAGAGTTNEHPLIKTALAHAFCCLIGSLDDSNPIIAQITSTQLASLNSTALLCGIHCLEFQFDAVIVDRCLILQRMHQLSRILPDQQVFTWEFFVNRFGLLALQAQMSALGLSDIESETETGLPKIQAPRFPGSRRSRMSMASFNGLFPASMISSEFMDSSNKFLSSIRSALDQDSQERDTLHQWVRLLLKFMSTVQFDLRVDENSSTGTGRHQNSGANAKDELRDRKALSKVQRHLAFLLGYADGTFNMPPHQMRNSTVFHSFLAHVGGVLDRNFGMGSCILHQTLVVLQFCASPQRYATDAQPPTFTLRLLDPQARLHWLQTLLVILYKYEYSAPGGSVPSVLGGATGSSNGGAGVGSGSGVGSVGGAGVVAGGIGTGAVGTPGSAATSTPHSMNALSSGGLGSSISGSRIRKSSSEAQLLDKDDPVRRITPPGGGPIGSSGHSPNTYGPSGTPGGGGTSSMANPLFGTPHHHYLTSASTGTTNLPAGGTRGLVEYLIQIVLNTMDAQVHVCRERMEDEPFETPTPPMRLRGYSTQQNGMI